MSYMYSKKKPRRPRRAISKSRAGASRNSSGNAANDCRIIESSGNVFQDLDFSPEESRNLLIRSNLMIQICQLIRRRKLSQNQAARLLGVTQPRITDLTRGKIELFSVDNLIAMLGRAGIDVEVHLKAKAA